MAQPQTWVQRPCFYWAYEVDADGKQFSIAWMVEYAPPFRHGKALRVRVRDRAVHIGLYRKAKKPFVREVEKTPEEIGKWVY